MTQYNGSTPLDSEAARLGPGDGRRQTADDGRRTSRVGRRSVFARAVGRNPVDAPTAVRARGGDARIDSFALWLALID